MDASSFKGALGGCTLCLNFPGGGTFGNFSPLAGNCRMAMKSTFGPALALEATCELGEFVTSGVTAFFGLAVDATICELGVFATMVGIVFFGVLIKCDEGVGVGTFGVFVVTEFVDVVRFEMLLNGTEFIGDDTNFGFLSREGIGGGPWAPEDIRDGEVSGGLLLEVAGTKWGKGCASVGAIAAEATGELGAFQSTEDGEGDDEGLTWDGVSGRVKVKFASGSLESRKEERCNASRVAG